MVVRKLTTVISNGLVRKTGSFNVRRQTLTRSILRSSSLWTTAPSCGLLHDDVHRAVQASPPPFFLRSFATDDKKKGKDESKNKEVGGAGVDDDDAIDEANTTEDSSIAKSSGSKIGYWEEKAAKKARRRQLYEQHMERQERLKVRRAGKPRNEKKVAFQRFFVPKKVREEYLNRKARQAHIPWKIRVAVIMVRDPYKLDHREDWELQYDQLSKYLEQFGKITGKMYPSHLMPDKDWSKVNSIEYYKQHNESVETEADKTGDVRTYMRKLQKFLYLTVVDNTQKFPFQLPTVDVIPENETLLDAARRCIVDQVGTDLEFWCPSNCPMFVDVEAFPENQRREAYGVKTFFMRVNHNKGDVSKNGMTVNDFAWLDRGEIVDKMREQQGEDVSNFYYYML
jgi:large subunit ribosomal protein L46